MTNTYSPTWFSLFLEPIQPSQTAKEVDFLSRHLPNPPYTTLLDVCCGQGRHANLLATKGYVVTGIDLNKEAVEKARAQANGAATYHHLDMRYIADLPDFFEAVLCLWQSFGYFDEATNKDILDQISRKLKPQGRLVLDVYHRGFFEKHQGVQTFERDGVRVTETKFMSGPRLTVQLDYNYDAVSDRFEWQLYTPDELCGLAEAVGLSCQVSCTNFDEQQKAVDTVPRMQLVFEKSKYMK